MVSPSHATGGTELNHQLVHELRRNSQNAFIAYYPFDVIHEKPVAFNEYDTESVYRFVPKTGDHIVIPESLTHLVSIYETSDIAIWWQSVDNYFSADLSKSLESSAKKIKSLFLRSRVPINKLRTYKHYVQSKYAEHFLLSYGIESSYLSDYIKDSDAIHGSYIRCNEVNRREGNQIIYNPMKGLHVTKKLMSVLPEFNFVPISNMTRTEVFEVMRMSYVYIDFGNHPGKDRMPREAALNGCIVITGVCGSASNDSDIPIDNKYKLDPKRLSIRKNIRQLIFDIVKRYDYHSQKQSRYRELILAEENLFTAQVRCLFM